MPDNPEKLQKSILALQQENENLQQSLASYEQIIGENNASLLRSDMARMELEQIFSSYSDPMWVIREDGIVIRANNAMLEMLGKTEEDIIGRPCAAFLNDSLCDQLACPLKNNHQVTHEIDIRLSTATSEGNYFLLTSAPLITIDGTPGIVAQFKDITSRKKAEAALELANASLEKMAKIDGLTQIANRRSFDDALIKEWLRLQRTEQPLSLLLGDIDYFKKYNDHYGHQAGDDCLRQVGKALAGSALRPADQTARYGGEEFVLLLPEVDIEGALEVGQRALDAIAKLSISHEKSEVSDIVSISIGAATLTPNQSQQPEELVALADKALYLAKEQGRNRVIVAEMSHQEEDTSTVPAPQKASEPSLF